jgi:2-iminobutanoate/2-iminopropanoate deaminase
MNRCQVNSDQAPAAVGPYSQGIRVGDLLFISGQLPLDPVTGEIVPGDASAVAEAAEADLASAVKVSVFLTDMADFPAVNAVYAKWFAKPYPSRSTVAVAALPLGATIEIEAVVAAPFPGSRPS